MKKKLMPTLLAVLIGTALLSAPVYATVNDSFTDVKETSWKYNGIQYKLKYKADHVNVVEYDQAGSPVSYTPLQLTIPKNTDSDVSVGEVKPDTGLVYINVDKWYQDSIYCFDQKSRTAFLAQEDASVLVKGGDTYFIGSSRTPTDISPRDYAIYKYTPTGCEKVVTLTSRGAGARYIDGKFYYATYPLPDYKTAYGDKFPDMHKMQIIRINPDGTQKKILKTITADKKSQCVYPEQIGKNSARVEIDTDKKTVWYSVKPVEVSLPDDDYLGYPGKKASDAWTVYKLAPYKGNRLLVAGTLYGLKRTYDDRARILKLSKHVKITNAARWDNHYKGGRYRMSLKTLCHAYTHENSKVLHLYIDVENGKVVNIMVESSYRL